MSLSDRFMPAADVTERHETVVHGPASLAFDVALHIDMQSLPAVRAILWLREKLLGAAPRLRPHPRGLVEETRALGWGVLAEQPHRALVMGAVTQPWKADVVFTRVAPDQFAVFAEPDLVKIVWTIETEPLGPALTRLCTETRAVATDAAARRKFLRYWRWARFGIVLIRRLLLPAIKREVERRARSDLAVTQ